jgi:hypothetical protein
MAVKSPDSNTTWSFIAEAPELSALNQELTTYLTLKNKNYVPPANLSNPDQSFGFIKNDFTLKTKIEARNDKAEDWFVIKGDSSYTRTLRCLRFRENCIPVSIAYLSHIGYRYFRFTVTLANTNDLLENEMILPQAAMTFDVYNDEYSKLAIGWRYAFLIITVPFSLAAIIYMIARQECRNWHGEQVWVLLLNVVMVLYNNPLYIFIYLLPTWVFPFVNIVFIVTFFCYLMFTVLVLAHAAVKQREQRSFVWFYLPKFILIGAIWVFVIIVFTYVRVQEKEDPSYDLSQDNGTVYFTLAVIVVVIVFVYLFIVGFYMFRAIGLAIRKKLPQRYSARARAVWIFTFVILLATIIDVFLYIFSRIWNNAAQLLSYFVIYNVYTVIVTIFYLPTINVQNQEVIQREEKQMIEEDHDLYEETFHDDA